MKILPVSPSFQGKRDNVDIIVNADENAIRQIAYAKTAVETNYDKKRKLAKALIYAAPVAAGLSHIALTSRKQTKIFSRQVHGLTAKIADGLKIGAAWGAGLATIGLMNKGLDLLHKKSESYRDFDKHHAMSSSFLNIAGAFGMLSLVGSASDALKNTKAPEFLQNATSKVNRFINKNETIKNTQKFIAENFAVLPKWLRNTAKTTAFWAPEALLLSGIMYGLKTSYDANKALHKNYADMKTLQSEIAQARVRELEVQNDFLMQDPQNQEDMALLNNPKAGL